MHESFQINPNTLNRIVPNNFAAITGVFGSIFPMKARTTFTSSQRLQRQAGS